MAKKMVSIEDVEVCFQSWIEHLKRQCADWEDNIGTIVSMNCNPEKINANTSIMNVCNVVNSASEIKALKLAIDKLERVYKILEMSAKEI